MYPQIFSAAKEVDQAFLIILGFSVFILVAVTVAMLWFLWRYNYKRNPKAADITGNFWAEVVWTVLPTIIVLGLFWTGWTSFKAMRTIPDGAMLVQVEGRMWSWKFTYENGKTSSELFAPVDTPIKLALSSRDVIHSFYIPAMRVKWDLVPGMDTDAWIQSDTVGEFDIFCAEYCGLKHADMITKLKVMTNDDFQQWLEGTPEEEGGESRGLALMEEFGCFDCHTMDGTDDIAPPLNGIAGKERLIILPDGTKRTIKADANYLKTSIMDPGAELVDGFDDEMPPYEGDLSDEDADVVVNYLLGKDETGKPLTFPIHPGGQLAKVEGCFKCHSIDGSSGNGPSFKGLYGSTITVRKAGKEKTVTADEDYILESITQSSKWIADGYANSMPNYDDLSEESVESLLSYIKSLGGEK